ncbi:hypothetical protein [Streptomyces sp. NPDC004285]
MVFALIVCVGVLAGVAWQRYRFPGTWAHAFSPVHADARKAWSAARSAARTWARSAAQGEAKASAAVTAAEKARGERLHRLEDRVAALSSPGRGERVAALGELELFQHVLQVVSPSGVRSFALAGLKVRFELGQVNYSVYCADADGHVHRAKYLHRAPVPDSDAELFNEDQVRDFAVTIENTVARENTFRTRLPRQLKEAESKWEEVRADTSEQDAARQRLQNIRQRNRTDPRHEAVEARVKEAAQEWERLTGRIPPR